MTFIKQIEIDASDGDDLILRRPSLGGYLLEMEIIDSEGNTRSVQLNGPSLREALVAMFGSGIPHY